MRTLFRSAAMMVLCIILPSTAASKATKRQDTVYLINLMPNFWDFWVHAEGKPPSQQLEAWQDHYVQPDAVVFHDLKTPCARHFNSTALKKDYFPSLPASVDGMQTLESSLPETISQLV